MAAPSSPDEQTNTEAETERKKHANLTDAKFHRLTEVLLRFVRKDTLLIFTDVQPTDFSWSLYSILATQRFMIRLNLLLVLLTTLLVNLNAQDKLRFEQENDLKECELDVPLYYSTKKQPELNKAVDKYRDVELVLLTIDKKKGTTYTFYYLVGWESSYGPSAYLIEPKYLEQPNGQQIKMFIDYKPKKHIFYDANCFRNNPASANLKEITSKVTSRN